MHYQNWVFTLNNPEIPYPELQEEIKYIIYQLEKGANDTLHLQGYLQLKKRASLQAVKSIIPRAHFERRKGTHEEARNYCTKDETRVEGPWEYGKQTYKRGQRNDIEEVREAIEQGMSEVEIAKGYFGLWCQNHKAFNRYRQLLCNNRSEKCVVTILVGYTGTGKSYSAYSRYPKAYWKMANKWWDHYEGQDEVILDDFAGEIDFQYILRMTDRYPMIVETKGATCQLQATKFIFTSNKKPTEWWPGVDITPFARRVTRYYTCFEYFFAYTQF